MKFILKVLSWHANKAIYFHYSTAKMLIAPQADAIQMAIALLSQYIVAIILCRVCLSIILIPLQLELKTKNK